jgi:hypothetical protein
LKNKRDNKRGAIEKIAPLRLKAAGLKKSRRAVSGNKLYQAV